MTERQVNDHHHRPGRGPSAVPLGWGQRRERAHKAARTGNRWMRWGGAYALLLLVVVAGAMGPAARPLALGIAIHVTTTDDLPPGGGVCVNANVPCSLRAAVALAPPVIHVPPGHYILGSGLVLTTPMAIIGEGESAPVIDASDVDRVFRITANVTLEHLTITNGRTTGDGGGILVAAGAQLVLRNSTVAANEANAGAGMYVAGTATVTGSTFTANQASGKGGAILDDGTLTVTNSTLAGNVAGGGGAIASSGTTTVSFVTVAGNTSTNKNGGGLYRVGGSFTVTGSIIAGNTNPTGLGHDCYGSPVLQGPNLVGNQQGCNPKGTAPLAGNPMLGPLADNGGPTQTRALLAGSPAINAAGATCPAGLVDQRGAARPGGLGCDLGAYEIVPLSLSIALSTDVACQGALCVPGVRSGVASLPQPGITPVPSGGGGGPSSTQLGAIQLGAIQLGAIQLGAIQLGAIQLGAIQLGAIDFSSTQLGAIQLGAIQLGAIQLGAIALSEFPVVWAPLLPGPAPCALGNPDVQTLADVSGCPEVQALSLEDLGLKLSATQLGAIELQRVQLGAIQLGAIQLGAIQLGAIQLGAIQLGAIQLGAIQLGAIQLGAIQLSNVPVEGGWEALLAGTQFADVPLQNLTLLDVYSLPQVEALTLAQVDLSATQLGAIQLGAILLNTYPLAKLPLPAPYDGATTDAGRLSRWCEALGAAGCAAAGLNEYSADDLTITLLHLSLAGIDFSGVPFAGAPLADLDAGSIATTQLGAIELDALANLNVVVDCALYPGLCDGSGTVGEAAAQDALRGTFGDLILGLVAPAELPWQDIDLSTIAVAEVGSPSPQLPDPMFHYLVALGVGGVAADVTVSVSLPPQFAYVGGTATIDGAPLVDCAAGVPAGGTCQVSRVGPTLTFTLVGLTPGSHTLAFGSRAGITLGPALASASASATAGAETAQAGPATTLVNVVEAFELLDIPSDLVPLKLGASAIQLAHISVSGETDLYSFRVTAAQAAVGVQATIYLGNLDSDFDLVLYGPGIVPLRGRPLAFLTGVGDATVSYVRDTNEATAETLNDIPLRLRADLLSTLPAPLPVVDAVSAHRGTRSELIETGALRAGKYFIQVSGYNGATSSQPFTLRTRLSIMPPLPACLAFSTLGVTNGQTTLLMPAPGATTVILVNEGRLRAVYGDVETNALLLDLQEFTTYLGTHSFGTAVVVPVDNDSADYDAWDTAEGQCSTAAANNVVRAIGKVLDSMTTPATKFVVIIGDDTQVPMARIPDGTRIANENSFGRSFITNVLGEDVGNPLVAALGGGNILTDDVYGASQPIVVDGHELYVPTVAVGRLVETPAEIRTALQNFIDFDGTIAPDTVNAPALVTGYDFLIDGSLLVADHLAAGPTGLPVSKLINATWSADDLKAALLAQAGGDGSCDDTGCVAAVNAHFDERRALPAGGGVLFTTDDLTADDPPAAALRAAVRRTFLFSMGCHAGLSVSDIQVGSTSDWAQVLSSNGASLLGNSGFGYGDTDTVALSELLMATFADQLRKTASVGEALVLSKQLYLQGTALIMPYDQKILQISTMYGLPMFRFAGAQPIVQPVTSAASLVEYAVAAASVGGITTENYSVDLGIGASSGPNTLHQVVTSRGRFFDVDGLTLNVVDRPIQPKVVVNIARTGKVAHGALITGLTSIDLGAFDPVYFRPTVDQSSMEPEPAIGVTFFPASPLSIPPVLPGSPLGQTLVVVPGQFRDAVPGTGIGTQRLFTHIAATVFYGDGSDFQPPTIVSTTATPGVSGTTITVVVADNDVAEVLVLWRALDTFGAVVWMPVSLASGDGGTTWTAVIGVPASGIQFFSQARDTSGNVASSFNKGGDFNTAAAGNGSPVLVVLAVPTFVNGWYSGVVEIVDITGGQGTLFYGVDGAALAPFFADAHVLVTGDGAHIVEARDSFGSRTTASFKLDGTNPVVTVAASPPATAGWNGGSVTVTGMASDGAGSGVVSFVVEATGAGVFPQAAVTGPVVVSTPGTTVLTFTATDLVGRVTSVSQTVKIDLAGPALSAVLTPAANGNGWNSGTVSVALSATDAGAGVVEVAAWVQTVGVCESNPPAGSLVVAVVIPLASLNLTPLSVSGDGIKVVCLYGKDAVGHTSTATTTVRIDASAPVVTVTASPPATAGGWNGGTVTVTGTASDGAGSGIVTFVVEGTGAGAFAQTAVAGLVVVSAEGTTVLTFTATDLVGRVTSVLQTVKIDATPPTVAINSVLGVAPPSPLAEALFALGAAATLQFSCSDGLSGSGIATCTATLDGNPIANGAALPTDSFGAHTVTVTALDRAGNQSVVSATYSANAVCRLWDVTKAFNGDGSTIPLKIRLCNAAGQNLSASSIVLLAVGLDGVSAPPNDAGKANTPFEFRYDGKLGGYIYNFKPPAPLEPGWHTLWFTIKGDTSVPVRRYAVVFLTE